MSPFPHGDSEAVKRHVPDARRITDIGAELAMQAKKSSHQTDSSKSAKPSSPLGSRFFYVQCVRWFRFWCSVPGKLETPTQFAAFV